MKITRFASLFIATILLIFSVSSPFVSANENDIESIWRDSTYYDPDAVASSCSAGGTLVGSDNAEKVFNFFVSKGLEPFQAAGILGNMQAESHVEPRLVQYGQLNSRGEISRPGEPSSLDDNVPPGARAGYGIVQFTPGTKLLPSASRLKMPVGDLAFQLTVVWEQLNGQGEIPETAAGDHLKATTSVEEASMSFEYEYERHAHNPATEQIRIDLSKQFLALYGSGTTSTSGSLSCGGTLSGGYSLPLDRKWYDDNPTLFTKPHHDYPAADIPIPTGTPVYSMTSGVLRASRGGCGIGVTVDADDGTSFNYCHGSDGGSVDGARPGDRVNAGQLIMHSASTGNSSGPHLHLGLFVGGSKVCPQNLFVGIAEGNVPAISSLPKTGCYY